VRFTSSKSQRTFGFPLNCALAIAAPVFIGAAAGAAAGALAGAAAG